MILNKLAEDKDKDDRPRTVRNKAKKNNLFQI